MKSIKELPKIQQEVLRAAMELAGPDGKDRFTKEDLFYVVKKNRNKKQKLYLHIIIIIAIIYELIFLFKGVNLKWILGLI